MIILEMKIQERLYWIFYLKLMQILERKKKHINLKAVLFMKENGWEI